jgi:N6-L-threonylcarbamoyladenine synthase
MILARQLVLGIETSCDETAAAVVIYENGRARVASNVVSSQIKDHAPYGGVVPEIAARKHVEKIDEVIKLTMQQAGIGFSDLSAVAATAGPGLIGGVLVGLLSAKAISLGAGLPLIAINHLEGHALSPKLTQDLDFPYLLLLVSGGHCQILKVEALGIYKRLGTTIDDALGEAFDKTAKLLGLGYPGGPLVENAARLGNPKFPLPRPMLNRDGCDFSFAGLKTAVARLAQSIVAEKGMLSQSDINDICASFQAATIDVLINRLEAAFAISGFDGQDRQLVVAGGVAANQAIRAKIETLCEQRGWRYFAPELKYCGDNGAMIALAGAMRLGEGIVSDFGIKARPRWPLDELSAPLKLKHGYGKKGAKV